MLRSVVGSDLGPILHSPIKYARPVTSNQYKILTFLEIDNVKIKIEIIREGNTTLAGALDPALGVPLLSRIDLWTQKLMANADCGLDKSTMSRDIIDLAMMIRGWGPIPFEAMEKARAAYGDSIARGFNNAMGVISELAYLNKSMASMGIDLELVDDIFIALDDASSTLPLTPEEQTEYEKRIAELPKLKESVGAPFIVPSCFPCGDGLNCQNDNVGVIFARSVM